MCENALKVFSQLPNFTCSYLFFFSIVTAKTLFPIYYLFIYCTVLLDMHKTCTV